jgi:hypothetical protein
MLGLLIQPTSYDIQLSAQHHRRGIGKMMMEYLSTICKFFDMDKLVLTVLKGKYKNN